MKSFEDGRNIPWNLKGEWMFVVRSMDWAA